MAVSKSLVFLFLAILFPRETIQYDKCIDPSLSYQGYTYTTDVTTGEKIWTHCQFPNPKYDGNLCGFGNSNEQRFVCDPDSLVTSQLTSIDSTLKRIQTSTSTLCTAADGTSESFMVGMLLVNRVRLPDLSATPCINDCDEIQPTLNTTARSATGSEKSAIMDNFATNIRTGWKLGQCGNDVIVFYCQELDMLYVSLGSKAASLVSSAVVDKIKSTFADYKAQGRIADGLLEIADILRKSLRGITPAHVLVILNMTGLALVAAFLFFFFHIQDTDMNIWGREGIWKIAENVVYALSGAWIFNGLLYLAIMMSSRAPFWGLVIASVGCIVLVVVYSLEESLFPDISVGNA